MVDVPSRLNVCQFIHAVDPALARVYRLAGDAVYLSRVICSESRQ